MSQSKSKCWYSNNCLHFLKCTVPLQRTAKLVNSRNLWKAARTMSLQVLLFTEVSCKHIKNNNSVNNNKY